MSVDMCLHLLLAFIGIYFWVLSLQSVGRWYWGVKCCGWGCWFGL